MSTLVLSPRPVDAERLRAGLLDCTARIAAYADSGAEPPADLVAELQKWRRALVVTFPVGAVVALGDIWGIVIAWPTGELWVAYEDGSRGPVAHPEALRWNGRRVAVPRGVWEPRWQDRQRAVRAALRAGGVL